MFHPIPFNHRLLLIGGFFMLLSPPAHAADTLAPGPSAAASAPAPGPAAPATLENAGSEAERVNVENIKEKYWARGDENELGVVQNRLYTKANHLELGVFGGIVTTDPFLSVQNVGGLLSYHFNEYFAATIFGFKDYVSPSSALQVLQAPVTQGGLGTTANTDNPSWFLGGEVAGSFLYGKLSVIGKAIIHYDMHLIAGVGNTSTETGNYITPYVGIGEQVYLTKLISLRLDYRLMRYDENIDQKVIQSELGSLVGTRVNYSNAVTLGLSFMINLSGAPAPAEVTK